MTSPTTRDQPSQEGLLERERRYINRDSIRRTRQQATRSLALIRRRTMR